MYIRDFSYHLPKLLIVKSDTCFIFHKSVFRKGVPAVDFLSYSNETSTKHLLLLEILEKYNNAVVYLCFFNGKICSLQIHEMDAEDFKYEYI